jgi:hypothetical protein
MSQRSTTFCTLCVLLMALPLPLAAAANADKHCAEAADAARAAAQRYHTFYLDAGWGGRTGRAAAHMNACHAAFAERGFGLVDIEINSENEDVEGYFLSYGRSADG